MRSGYWPLLLVLGALGACSTTGAHLRIPQDRIGSAGFSVKLVGLEEPALVPGIQAKVRVQDSDEVFAEWNPVAFSLKERDVVPKTWKFEGGWVHYFQPGVNDGWNLALSLPVSSVSEVDYPAFDLRVGFGVIKRSDPWVLEAGLTTSFYMLAGALHSHEGLLGLAGKAWEGISPLGLDLGAGLQEDYGGGLLSVQLWNVPSLTVEGMWTP